MRRNRGRRQALARLGPQSLVELRDCVSSRRITTYWLRARTMPPTLGSNGPRDAGAGGGALGVCVLGDVDCVVSLSSRGIDRRVSLAMPLYLLSSLLATLSCQVLTYSSVASRQHCFPTSIAATRFALTWERPLVRFPKGSSSHRAIVPNTQSTGPPLRPYETSLEHPHHHGPGSFRRHHVDVASSL